MKSKFISCLMLASAVALGAQAQTGTLYIEDTTVSPGQKATLSLQMTNDFEVRGFQFVMTLPEGVTITKCVLSENRLPSGVTTSDVSGTADIKGNYVKWPCTLNTNDANVAFTGDSGEIGLISIEVDESVAEGTYTVELTGIDLTTPAGKDYEFDDTSFNLTIGEPEYDQGYAVDFLPFLLTAEIEAIDVPLTMDNTNAITNIAFDCKLPADIVANEFYSFNNILGKLKWTVSSEATSDEIVHVNIDAKGNNKIAAGEDNEFATLTFGYDESVVPVGVYTIQFKNIELTDVDGNTYSAAPYSTEMFVGTSPKATVTNGVVAFHGDYSGASEYALMTAAFPTGATIDLTEVSAMAGDPTTLTNDNVTATSSAVAYGRTVSSEWGTICLPFAVTSNDNIQFYEFTGASADALTFEKVTTLTANSPAIFKATGSSFVLKKNTTSFDATYPTTTPNVTVEQAVSGWSMNGYYVTETIDVSGTQAYILSGGEFHKVTSKLTAKAFHAWIENDGSASNARFRIQENTNGIEFVEEGENTVKLIYDLQGRLQKSGSKNQLFIENGKMMYNK